MLPFFDLHCDTFLELFKKKEQIKDNSLHISHSKATKLSPYIQVGAIWSDYRLSNGDAFKNFLAIVDYLADQGISFLTDLSKLDKNNFILGVEDARLLNNDLSRLDILYSKGVRILTLNWKGVNIIGGGWDTNIPLTEFGKNVVRRCCELGIIVDLSHSSTDVFFDALELTNNYGASPIASHSNSFSICNHKRNLSDEQFKALSKTNSIIGISFVPQHLGNNATTDTIISHIDHFLKLGGENNIAFGSDFDGTNDLPKGIYSIESIHILHSELVTYFGETITKKLFYDNAFRFFNNYLRKEPWYVSIHNGRFAFVFIC